MVRKIKTETDKEIDALTNPKRSGRKYRQALGKALEENELTYNDFIGKPMALNKKNVEDSTLFTLFVSKEILDKKFSSLEKIMVGLLNKEIKERFPDKEPVSSLEAKFKLTEYDIRDVVFFETMLVSPDNERMFKKIQDVITNKTNASKRLKKLFPEIKEEIDEYVNTFFREEKRQPIIEWHKQVIGAMRDFSTMTKEEIEEKYLILEKDAFVISSLEEEIWVKFLGYEKGGKAYSFDILYGGDENHELNKKISESMDRNCWTINGKFCVKKEWIKILKDLIKENQEKKISGFLEYFPEIQKKVYVSLPVKEKTVKNQTLSGEEDKENLKISVKEDINEEEFSFKMSQEEKQNNEKEIQEIKPFGIKNDFKLEELQNSIECLEDVPLKIKEKFVPVEINSNINLEWYNLEENVLTMNTKDMEHFYKLEQEIENIMLSVHKKKKKQK